MRWRSVGCKCYVQQRPAADPGRTISGNERSASQDMRGASCEKTCPGGFDRCACVGRGPRTPFARHLVRQTRSKPPLLCHTMLAVSSHSASPHWRVPPRGERCGLFFASTSPPPHPPRPPPPPRPSPPPPHIRSLPPPRSPVASLASERVSAPPLSPSPPARPHRQARLPHRPHLRWIEWPSSRLHC